MFRLSNGTRVCWLLSLAAFALALCGLAATAVDVDMGEPGVSSGPADAEHIGVRRVAEPAGPVVEVAPVGVAPAAEQRHAGIWPHARLSSVCTNRSLPAYTFDRFICSIVRRD